MVPVESGLSGTWAATEYYKLEWVLASKGFGCDEDLSTLYQSWAGDTKFFGRKTAHTRLFEI